MVGDNVGSSTCTFTEKLAQLEAKINLLDVAKLESIGRKAQLVGTHLSSLAKQKKQAAPSSEQDQLVDKLYSTMERWDTVAATVPSVVARLHALKGLQDSSLTLAATVD